MIGFYLVYLPGNVFRNTFASTAAELVAVTFGGVLYGKLLAQKTFALSFAVSLVGGILIVLFSESVTVMMPEFVIISKFGISCAFLSVYIANMEMFPTLFCGTAFGIC